MDCISKRHAVATIQPKAVNRAWIQTTQKNMRRLYHTMDAKAKRLGATELRPSCHGDPVRRASYRRRHAGILLANGKSAFKNKTKPAFWDYHLLW